MRFVRLVTASLLLLSLVALHVFGADKKKIEPEFNPESILLGNFSFKRPPNWQWMHTENGGANHIITEITFHVTQKPEDQRYATVLMNHFKPNVEHAMPETVAKRWKNWFVEVHEWPSEQVTLGKHQVTFLEYSGTYHGPGASSKNKRASPNYRFYGAVIEDDGGNVIGRFYGPETLVTQYKADFRHMIENALKQEE